MHTEMIKCLGFFGYTWKNLLGAVFLNTVNTIVHKWMHLAFRTVHGVQQPIISVLLTPWLNVLLLFHNLVVCLIIATSITHTKFKHVTIWKQKGIIAKRNIMLFKDSGTFRSTWNHCKNYTIYGNCRKCWFYNLKKVCGQIITRECKTQRPHNLIWLPGMRMCKSKNLLQVIYDT